MSTIRFLTFKCLLFCKNNEIQLSDVYPILSLQTPDEIKEYRENKMNSPWRDRSISESLKMFEEMRRGMIDEGKATLRLKQDMQSDNKNMYDLIAYRIKASSHLYCFRHALLQFCFSHNFQYGFQFTPHPHAGDKWCIYPSYDYAHCIVDSLENISHSVILLSYCFCIQVISRSKHCHL